VADKQIFRTGPVDAPFSYELEPSETFQPLIIQAVLDGSGAAGPWLPAVVYESREGHVIGRAVADSPLKAGDDAAVTWFPRLRKAAAAAAAAALPRIFVDFNGVQVFPHAAAAFTRLTWALATPLPNDTFDFPGTGGPTRIRIKRDGLYRFVYTYAIQGLGFPAGPNALLSTVFAPSAGEVQETLAANATTAALYRGDPALGPTPGPVGELTFNIQAPGDVSLAFSNRFANPITIVLAEAFIVRLGDKVF
jgi:hypothetical protein